MKRLPFKAVNLTEQWSGVETIFITYVQETQEDPRLDVVLNAPEDTLDQSFMNKVNQKMLKRAKDFCLDDLEVNISVIPNSVYKFDNQTMNYCNGCWFVNGLAISGMA